MPKFFASLPASQARFTVEFFVSSAVLLIGLFSAPAPVLMQTNGYTISGDVRADDANLAGATVTLAGGQTATVTTGADGNYSFTVPAGANYTVSVYKNGYNFNPAYQTFSSLQWHQVANFQNGTPLCAPPLNELRAWFKGDGSSPTADSTGNGHDGILRNGATTTSSGKVENAFRFDGVNDYFKATNEEGLRMSNQFSLSAWIYPTGAGSGQFGSGGVIISKEGEYVIGRAANGEIFYSIANTEPGWTTQNTEYVAPLNQWTHLTFVYDGAAAKLYADGAIVYSAAATGELGDFYAGLNDFYIGGRQLNAQHFAGRIDEAQIYNRALSAAEAETLHAAGSAGVCANSTLTLPVQYERLAYSNTIAGGTGKEIIVSNTDGSNKQNVSNNAGDDTEPSWSPNGSQIVFSGNRGNVNIQNLYRVNRDGTGFVQLTNNTDLTYGGDFSPEFSPDSSKIVFARSINGNSRIWTMNADGSGQVQLTNGFSAVPSWSPNGSKIIYQQDTATGRQIYSMNSDGSGKTPLTSGSSDNIHPKYSPDGSKIVFTSNRSGNYNLWLMNSDGSNSINLSNAAVTDQSPDWSPDGSKIIFQRTIAGTNYIFTMNADGTQQTNIMPIGVSYTRVSWGLIRPAVSVTLASNVSVTFDNLTRAGHTAATPIANASAGVLPPGYNLDETSAAFDIRTSAVYSGNVTTTFTLLNVPSATTCAGLRALHYNQAARRLENATTGVNIYNAAEHTCIVAAQTTSLSPFVIAQSVAPTAAQVSVRGRVTTASGDGIRNVFVTLTDSNGNSRSKLTGKFGAFQFRDVAAGETYVISVSARRYSFSQPSQVRFVSEDLTDIDFIADEN